jgi:uncharacterized membrane protein YphA (DoxX/SURF4 family)
MSNPFASETSTNLGIFVARLALGASLLMTGYSHFSGGVKGFAVSNAANLRRLMPWDAASGYSQCLPFIEMAAGAMLVLGLTTRFGAFLAAVTAGVVLSAHGVHFQDTDEKHLPVYLALAFLLLCLGGGRLTLDGLLFKKRKAIEEPGAAH